MKNQQIINNWRIKLWDESDNEGAWTNGNDFFVMAGKRIQDLAYTYDNVGNVTQIVDQSETNTRKSATYAYDDLYRLTSATITDSATDEDYTQTYSYDSLGNFTNRSDMGDYEYEGNTGSSYANPHAMTDAGGVIVDYDHNGNLTSAYAGPYNLYAPTWDYNNRMVASAGTFQWPVEYLYDHAGSRVKMDANTGEEVIVYPNKYYELKTDGEVETVTESIYAQNQLVATLTDDGTTSSLYYVHGDHLGSSSVMTKDDANIEQIVDYYPYGNTRFNQQSDPENGSYDIDKKFTSHFYDKHTDLAYMGARYYIGVAGKFLSEDPAFLVIGDNSSKWKKQLYRPQSLNSYAYANNNPLVFVDPTGNTAVWYNPFSWPVLSDIIELAPLTGDICDAHALIAGKTLFTERSVSENDKELIGMAAMLPFLTAGEVKMGDRVLRGSDEIAPRLLNPEIKIGEERFGHVLERHTLEGIKSTGASIFNKGEDIYGLIKSGTQQAMKQQKGGNFERIIDIGRNIGIDRVTGQQTSIMTIITDVANELKTAFPGIPKK